MKIAYLSKWLLAIAALFSTALPAQAAEPAVGMAHEWQESLQTPASPVMERLFDFHHLLLIIITVTSVFVLLLMIYTCVRFSAKNNPRPSKTTHNTLIEIVWTLIPVLILIAIAIPSWRHLHYMAADEMEDADMTIKVVGNQWFWNYEYPDHGGFAFDSYMIKDADIDAKKGQVRLLSVDNPIYVPVGKKVRVQLTGADVIHSWAMPAFGVKTDAMPGHLNQTWFQVDKPGVYYGQCSELCGVNHGFMPIEVRAVSEGEFKQWVEQAKKKFASNGNASLTVASAR